MIKVLPLISPHQDSVDYKLQKLKFAQRDLYFFIETLRQATDKETVQALAAATIHLLEDLRNIVSQPAKADPNLRKYTKDA